MHLCDWITDNVDDGRRCVATTGRLGRGMRGADVELPMPADSRGNGECKAPADNWAMADDSWFGRDVARAVRGGANTIAAAAGPVINIHQECYW